MDSADWKQLSAVEWSQPHTFQRSYELRQGESLIGSLEFTSAFGSLARGAAGDAAWTFKRTGFLSTKITARTEGSETDVAVFEPGWTGGRGTLHLRGGEQLRLKSAGFWHTEWSLADSAGQDLIHMHNRGVLHIGASVELSAAGRLREDCPLLVLMTWYVLLLHMQDAAAAASAAG